MLERFVDREVGVVKLDVLPDQGDLDGLVAVAEPLDELVPRTEVGLVRLQAELLADKPVEPLLLKRLRHQVNVGHVHRRHDGSRVDIGEERDLVADLLRQRLGRAADEHVGRDTDAAQLIHRMLSRLRLQLARVGDERHQRHVDVENVVGADLATKLPDRLEERLRLDVAHRPADLRDNNVGIARLGDGADPCLDLVRDVRDHLHRRAEVLAFALFAQHPVPDAACRVICGARKVLVDEALVVADVEIGFGAVLGHEDLAVLKRAHRSRIDVDVRVELLHLHLQPARLEQAAERGSGDALAEGRDDASCDEHVLRAHRDRLSVREPTGLKRTATDRGSLIGRSYGRGRTEREIAFSAHFVHRHGTRSSLA